MLVFLQTLHFNALCDANFICIISKFMILNEHKGNTILIIFFLFYHFQFHQHMPWLFLKGSVNTSPIYIMLVSLQTLHFNALCGANLICIICKGIILYQLKDYTILVIFLFCNHFQFDQHMSWLFSKGSVNTSPILILWVSLQTLHFNALCDANFICIICKGIILYQLQDDTISVIFHFFQLNVLSTYVEAFFNRLRQQQHYFDHVGIFANVTPQ